MEDKIHYISGFEIDIKKAITKKESYNKLSIEKQNKVYISCLPFNSVDVFERYFEKYGEIQNIRIFGTNYSKKQPFGFVSFTGIGARNKVLKHGDVHYIEEIDKSVSFNWIFLMFW